MTEAALRDRVGGDRDLSRVLSQLVTAGGTMSRAESRGLATLVNHLLDAHSHGNMGVLLSSLNSKAEVRSSACPVVLDTEINLQSKLARLARQVSGCTRVA